MIIVTGGTGFIGSCVVRQLNNKGIDDILVVDSATATDKNLVGANYTFMDTSKFYPALLHALKSELCFKDYSAPSCANVPYCANVSLLRNSLSLGGFDDFFLGNNEKLPPDMNFIINSPSAIIHLGANTNTLDDDAEIIKFQNLDRSNMLLEYCIMNKVRMIYSSTSAVYGNSFDKRNPRPLNAYAQFKYLFDLSVKRVLSMNNDANIVGLRLFNVYGHNESHKGNMASMIYRMYEDILKTGRVHLFKSHISGIADGEQKRDFVYVNDIVSVIIFMLEKKNIRGIFEVGTGNPVSFNDAAKIVHGSMSGAGIVSSGKSLGIEYIDVPFGMLNSYQYFTHADLSGLKSAGYNNNFMQLGEGVKDYVTNYLSR
jgi:ADP-L-glycero-D-manno-heptose 6-epimerase